MRFAKELSSAAIVVASAALTATRLRVDPPVGLGSLDAPLPADLEGRDLPGLRHRVHGLLGELQQCRDLLDGQDLVSHGDPAWSELTGSNGIRLQAAPSNSKAAVRS